MYGVSVWYPSGMGLTDIFASWLERNLKQKFPEEVYTRNCDRVVKGMLQQKRDVISSAKNA
jgi:hypothetical protein